MGGKIEKIGLIAHGVFLVRFQSIEVRDNVLDGGFIFFDRKPFIMKPLNAIENFAHKDITVIPTWIQARGIELKYWGDACLFKIVEQIGKPIQVDESTKNRDKLLFPRVLVEVKMGQDFPTSITFTDEFDMEVEVSIHYEWLPKLCNKCKGIGHEATECRNKATITQKWVPKKVQPEKIKEVDEERFEVVKKGKKVQLEEQIQIPMANGFTAPKECPKEKSTMRGLAGPSNSNG